ATSNAQNDSGIFDLNFRDERFLPFEGFGAVSEWQLQLPSPHHFPTFDYNTISDVVLHLSYIAIDGRDVTINGKTYREIRQEQLRNTINTLLTNEKLKLFVKLFDLRHDFPNEWHQFLQSDDPQLDLILKKQHFPYFLHTKIITFLNVSVILKFSTSDELATISQPISGIKLENATNDASWSIS